MPAPVLLTDQQVQDYLTQGYLVLRTGHPAAFHCSILRQISDPVRHRGQSGQRHPAAGSRPLSGSCATRWSTGHLRSLLGADYLVHPHRHCHENPSGSDGQRMHQDSYENDQNVRHHRTRWAMAFYYPQDVPLELGPTAILPASQYYETGAQAHRREELALCGAAGTVTVVHYDLWHRAMANTSDRHRYMVQVPVHPHERAARGRVGPPRRGVRLPLTMTRRPPCADGCGTGCGRRSGTRQPTTGLSRAGGRPWSRVRRRSGCAPPMPWPAAARMRCRTWWRRCGARRRDLRDRNLAADHTNPSQLDAVFALSAVGAPAVPALAALLDDEAWWVRAAAADVLGDMGEIASETVPRLAGVLSDDSVWVRRNAVEALGYLGPAASSAVPVLSRSLSDADSRVRHNAALTLAKLGPAAAAAGPALRRTAADAEPYTRANAAVALERIGA